MRKLRSSTKILIGFVGLTAGVILGYRFISNAMIMRVKYDAVVPGKVNIVGINPGAGFRVIVSNEIAQLVESQGSFSGDSGGEGGATEGAIKKRIPIREMLGTLQGDPKSLGDFVMKMNNLSENDLPPVRVLWTKDQIEKAVSGDKPTVAKLEHDLNIHLDGSPLPTLNLRSLENGIVIEAPVSLTVSIDGKPKAVTGIIYQAYKPRMMKAVETQYADKPNPDNAMIAGYYEVEAKKANEQPRSREDVKGALKTIVSDTTARALAEAPERILRDAFVVVNDKFITDAHYSTYDSNDGKKMHDLTIDLNDEGRKRLWQFSKNRVGDQLLLVADGVAIAAPRIQHELAQGELTITKMPDEVMVKTAVDAIKSNRTAKL